MATTEMDLADVNASIDVSSAAFGDEQQIPARYTSDGEGLSPPIEWRGVPMNAEAVVVLMEDVESSTVHAIAWDLPGSDTSLPEDSGKSPSATYVPPNPPPGRGQHRYAIQVFALDTVPRFDSRPGRVELLDRIKGHVLAKGVLVGTYERK